MEHPLHARPGEVAADQGVRTTEGVEGPHGSRPAEAVPDPQRGADRDPGQPIFGDRHLDDIGDFATDPDGNRLHRLSGHRQHRGETTQFAIVFLLALGLVGAAFYLILNRVYVNELRSQAETVADNVDAFGSWVAQYGRVWVKDDDRSYLGHLGRFCMEPSRLHIDLRERNGSDRVSADLVLNRA